MPKSRFTLVTIAVGLLVLLTTGLVEFVSVGPAGADIVATGSVTCSFTGGGITFNPALNNTGGSAETVSFTLYGTSCSTSNSNVTVTKGTLRGSLTYASNLCSDLLNSEAISATENWPDTTPHVADSTLSVSGYATTTDSSSGFIEVVIPPSGGTTSVTGSFPGSDGGASSSLTAITDDTSSHFLNKCGTANGIGRASITGGSETLG